MNIFLLLLIVGITWWLLDEVYYSPKAQVKKIWKEIFRVSAEMPKLTVDDPSFDYILTKPYEDLINKKKKMINALLDYYFDPEEDKEFLREYRP